MCSITLSSGDLTYLIPESHAFQTSDIRTQIKIQIQRPNPNPNPNPVDQNQIYTKSSRPKPNLNQIQRQNPNPNPNPLDQIQGFGFVAPLSRSFLQHKKISLYIKTVHDLISHMTVD